MARGRDPGGRRAPARRPAAKGAGAGRPVSGPEADLWGKVTETMTPLEAGRRARRADRAPEPQAPAEGQEAAPAATPTRGATPARQPARAVAKTPAGGPAPALPPPAAPPPLSPGAAPGVDRRTAERLKRGQIPIEAKIDLHGYRLEEAHRALDMFLERAAAAGRRCVLVITGRGLGPRREESQAARVMPRGVLREQVPRWLNEPANRARILAFCQAQPKHGGAGAIYVLLKKRR